MLISRAVPKGSPAKVASPGQPASTGTGRCVSLVCRSRVKVLTTASTGARLGVAESVMVFHGPFRTSPKMAQRASEGSVAGCSMAAQIPSTGKRFFTLVTGEALAYVTFRGRRWCSALHLLCFPGRCTAWTRFLGQTVAGTREESLRGGWRRPGGGMKAAMVHKHRNVFEIGPACGAEIRPSGFHLRLKQKK